jgi:hypothetical protein
MHCAIDSAQWHRIKKLENWKNCLQLKQLFHTIKNVVKIIWIKIIVWPFWPHFVHCAPWPWQEQAAVSSRGLNMIALPLVTFNVDNLKHKRHSIKQEPCFGSWKVVQYFVQLGFNLSNGVPDTLESSTILIYLETRMSLYTQRCGEMLYMIKWLIKLAAKILQFKVN